MQFVIGFVAPFTVIVGAYAALGARLRRLLASGSKAAVKHPGRAMTRTTLVVTLAFLVTQLPFYVVEILHALKADQLASAATNSSHPPHQNETSQPPVVPISPASAAEMRLYIWLNVISKMLVFVSCCVNPIIYGLLNHNYSQFFAIYHCYLTLAYKGLYVTVYNQALLLTL